MTSFASVSLKKKNDSTTPFDSVEIAPLQKNFGTISKQNRPTQRHLMGFNSLLHNQPQPGNQTDAEREEQEIENEEKEYKENKKEKKGPKARKKFGTFDGVLARCLLCIWGVIMYLRTGWIVGHAGIWQTSLIMLLAASVTTLTSLSLSAICTNGEVKAGGYYFLISRSLGPEFGGIIGILFALANCISVAIYLIGFSETITSLYSNDLAAGWDIQMWAAIILIMLFLLALRGVSGIIKLDMLLLVLLVISIFAFFIGTIPGVTPVSEKLLYTGYRSSTFETNWNSAYIAGESFISVFSVFFPAVTGEMAGANISGDLRDPSKSIPKGTLSAIFLSTVVYIVIAWVLGATIERGSPGAGTGLYGDYMIMSKIALWQPLVIIGIFASTLSSALSCFVGAPRIFQAVCQDNVFPALKYFAKGRGTDGEPVRAYVIVLAISLLSISTGNINFIAPIITNFFLITYTLMNYSCFSWSLTKSPGWRPSFKYYHPYVSLFAACECLVLMFVIDWIMALVTVIIGSCMYKYVSYIEPTVTWGTTQEALKYMTTCKDLLKYQQMLKSSAVNAKIERPTFLLFNNNKPSLVAMFEFATAMNVSSGLIMIGDVIVGSHEDPNVIREFIAKKRELKFDENEINDTMLKKCVVEVAIADSFVKGVRIILQTAGIGGIRPNVVLFRMALTHGHKSTVDLHAHDIDDEDTIEIVLANDDHKLEKLDTGASDGSQESQSKDEHTKLKDRDSVLFLSSESKNLAVAPYWIEGIKDSLSSGCGVVMVKGDINWSEVHTTGFIDIWWLYDDGGLTLLIPYLLSQNPSWKNCTLRLMTLESIGLQDKLELVLLMKRLRIKAEMLSVTTNEEIFNASEDYRSSHKSGDVSYDLVADVTDTDPKSHGVDQDDDYNFDEKARVELKRTKSLRDDTFRSEKLNAKNMTSLIDSIKEEHNIEVKQTDSRISKFAAKKIEKYKYLGKLIERSRKSELCVVTMPFPRPEYSWYEYMKIIQALSPKEMSMLFIRGNQQQVLTYQM